MYIERGNSPEKGREAGGRTRAARNKHPATPSKPCRKSVRSYIKKKKSPWIWCCARRGSSPEDGCNIEFEVWGSKRDEKHENIGIPSYRQVSQGVKRSVHRSRVKRPRLRFTMSGGLLRLERANYCYWAVMIVRTTYIGRSNTSIT